MAGNDNGATAPGFDPSALSGDKTFLSMSVPQQMDYLSYASPDFKGMKSDDKLGYLNHLTGKQAPTTANNSIENGTAPLPKLGHVGMSDVASALTPDADSGILDIAGRALKGAGHGIAAMNPFKGALDATPEQVQARAKEATSIPNMAAGAFGPLGKLAKSGYEAYTEGRNEGAGVGESLARGASGAAGLDAGDLARRGREGDVAGAFGSGIPAIAMTLMGGRPEETADAAAAMKNKITGANPTAEGAAAKFMEVGPPKMRETGYAQKLAGAIPDVQKIVEDYGSQLHTPRDFVEAIENHIDDLESPIREAAKELDRNGHEVDVTPAISSRVKAALDQRRGAIGFTPAARDAIMGRISEMLSHAKTPFELENLRKSINDQSSAWFNASPAERASMSISEPDAVAFREAGTALRDELYGTDKKPGIFENAGLPGDFSHMRDVRQRVGNLLDLRNHVNDAVVKAEKTGNWDAVKTAFTRNPSGGLMSGGIGAILGGMVGGKGGALLGGVLGEGWNLLKSYRESKNPNLNLQKAISNVRGMGAAPELSNVKFSPATASQSQLPFEKGPLFQINQTPAPAVTPAPAPIVGEQMPMDYHPGSLFQIHQSAAPPPPVIGPLAETPGRTYARPQPMSTPEPMLGRQAPGGPPPFKGPALQMPAIPAETPAPTPAPISPSRTSLIRQARERAARIRDRANLR